MPCAKSIVKGPIEHRHCPICRAGIKRVVNVGHKAIRWDSEDFIPCEDGVGEYIFVFLRGMPYPFCCSYPLHKPTDIVTIQQSPNSMS